MLPRPPPKKNCVPPSLDAYIYTTDLLSVHILINIRSMLYVIKKIILTVYTVFHWKQKSYFHDFSKFSHLVNLIYGRIQSYTQVYYASDYIILKLAGLSSTTTERLYFLNRSKKKGIFFDGWPYFKGIPCCLGVLVAYRAIFRWDTSHKTHYRSLQSGWDETFHNF